MGIGYLTVLVLLLSVSITVINVLLPINALPALMATSRLVVLALSATARLALPLVALHVWMAISLTLLPLHPALRLLELPSSPIARPTQSPDLIAILALLDLVVLVQLINAPPALAVLLLPLVTLAMWPVVELAHPLSLL